MTALPTPYYSDGSVTIYHGDCRDILPLIAPRSFDLLLTDPPYGIGRDGMKRSSSSHGGRKAYDFLGWDKEIPPKEVFDLMFAVSKEQIIWGANYFVPYLLPSMGWLFWDKGQRIAGSDGELAFTSFKRALRVITLNRVEIAVDGAVHPTQKPLKLMRWCIASAPDTRSIIDPFMGSGTTLRAAKDMGCEAVGIETEERYCELAARRMQQSVLPMFEDERPRAGYIDMPESEVA